MTLFFARYSFAIHKEDDYLITFYEYLLNFSIMRMRSIGIYTAKYYKTYIPNAIFIVVRFIYGRYSV